MIAGEAIEVYANGRWIKATITKVFAGIITRKPFAFEFITIEGWEGQSAIRHPAWRYPNQSNSVPIRLGSL